KEMPFEISDSNVDGLELKAAKALVISGIVVLDGSDNSKTSIKPYSAYIGVTNISEDKSRALTSVGIGPDRTFRLPITEPGKLVFFLRQSGSDGGLFIKFIDFPGVG